MVEKIIISELLNNTGIATNPNGNPTVAHLPEGFKTRATFQINSAKLYVSLVTLSINNNIKFLENTKQGFKRTFSSNKYRSEITTQPKNNN